MTNFKEQLTVPNEVIDQKTVTLHIQNFSLKVVIGKKESLQLENAFLMYHTNI